MGSRRIGLDNPTFAGRIRSYQPRAVLVPSAKGSSYRQAQSMVDVRTVGTSKISPSSKPKILTSRTPKVQPVKPKQMKSKVLLRTTVKKKRFKRRKPHLSLRQSVITFAAVMLFASGAFINFQSWRVNEQAVVQVKALSGANDQSADDAKDGSAEIPNEEPVTAPAIQRYSVAPDLPVRISIQKINVKARILPMSVKPNGELKAPYSIFDVGWYNASAKPGASGGATVLDGHVSGLTQKGIFANLKQLEIGDQINVERGDGQVFTYAVRAKKQTTVDTVDMAGLLVSVGSKHGLNIITCAGKFDAKKIEYSERLIVFAEQL